MRTVDVTYFSDVLCIWAYVAQARVEATRRTFGDKVHLRTRFCSVFGDAHTKLAAAWHDRDGVVGYNRHVTQIAKRFPHVEVDPQVWIKTQPASSASPHLFLSAVMEWETKVISAAPGTPLPIFETVMWAFRLGFFRDGHDIAQWETQCELARPLGVDLAAVTAAIDDGSAFARLAADYQDADKMRIEGSPTFVLNEGRQKLYGNVGFRIIDANIREILKDANAAEASWC